MTSDATLTLTPYEAELAIAALDGLAQQIGTAANRLPHGPQQVAACHAAGAMRQIARRIRAQTA